MKKIIAVISIILMCMAIGGCSNKGQENRVIIYSSAEEYRQAFIQEKLNAKFPEYEIVIEYLSSGKLASKLLAEGKTTACDIFYDMEYGHVDKLTGIFADLSSYDMSKFDESMILPGNKIAPECRSGGCIAINPEVLAEKGLPKPASYEDLVDPKYKGLISMPNPKSSGTGYMFLKSLVNAWGEEKAFTYFDQLALNVKQFTSSGSGPVNALVQKEAAIGLAMTAQTVTEINNGVNLEIMFFKEGSPYSAYGMGMIDGKQNRAPVKAVFDYLYDTLAEEDKALYFPEKIYKDKDFTIKNYPTNIPYADMSNNTAAEKTRLTEKWKY